MIEFIRFRIVWDGFHPLWINDNGICEYYEDMRYVGEEYNSRMVAYLSQDGDGILTLELV